MKNAKQEVMSYLTKTSKHFFKNEKGDTLEVKFNPETGVFTYTGSPRSHSIEDYLIGYKENTKCVIKHILFLGKGFKSVKRPKVTVESV